MPQNAAEEIRIRRQLAWKYSCQGWTQVRIAAELQVTQQQISDDLKAYRAQLSPVDIEAIRQRHTEQIRMASEMLFELTQKDGAPVLAGQQGDPVRDPETGEWVRDYGGRVQALKELRMFQDREAKLMGLDAAMKIDHTGTVEIQGSVDVELRALAAELGLDDAETDTEAQA